MLRTVGTKVVEIERTLVLSGLDYLKPYHKRFPCKSYVPIRLGLKIVQFQERSRWVIPHRGRLQFMQVRSIHTLLSPLGLFSHNTPHRIPSGHVLLRVPFTIQHTHTHMSCACDRTHLYCWTRFATTAQWAPAMQSPQRSLLTIVQQCDSVMMFNFGADGFDFVWFLFES